MTPIGINAAGLQFNPETHEYSLDGKIVPGVTTVLGSVGIINTAWFREEAAWRGSVIHRACELDDLDDLDESTVAEEARGYLAAYRRFQREMLFTPIIIEKSMYSEQHDFAGTPDRIGVIEGCTKEGYYKVCLDLKSGSIAPWARLQLAAYSELAGVFRRIALRLDPSGNYVAHEYPVAERRADLHIFWAALAIYKWEQVGR